MNNEVKATLENCFNSDNALMKAFITSDNQVFTIRHYADQHSVNLPDKNISTAYRPGLTPAQISQLERDEAKKMQADHESAIRMALPEFARMIDINKASGRRN